MILLRVLYGLWLPHILCQVAANGYKTSLEHNDHFSHFPFTCLEIARFLGALELERFKQEFEAIQFLLPELHETMGWGWESKRSSPNEMLTYSVMLVKSLHLTDYIHLCQLVRSSQPLFKIAVTFQFYRLGNWALRSLNDFPQVTEPERVTLKHQYRIQN